MAANGIWNFTIDQGATFDRTLTWYTDASQTSLVDLSGYTAAMQLRPYSSSPDLVLSLSSPAGGITLGGALGTIRILISHIVTATLLPGKLVYDLEMSDSSGAVARLLRGDVHVVAEVTR